MPQFKLKIDLSADPYIQKALNEVKTGVFNRAMRQALRKLGGQSAKVSRTYLRGVAKRRTGQLDKSLGFVLKSYRRGGTVVLVFGPRRNFRLRLDMGGGYAMNVNPTKYGRLVEGGRAPVRPIHAKALRLPILSGFKRSKTILPTGARAASAKARFLFRKSVRAAAPRPFMEPVYQSLSQSGGPIIAAYFEHELKTIARNYARKGKSILK